MHDRFDELTRPRTLDDLLEETEALAAEGAREGRRGLTMTELDRFARAAGAVEVVDGTTGPAFPVERAPRPVRTLTLRDFATAVDVDGDSSPESIMAREDLRHGGFGGDPDHVPGGTYDGLEECARGARRVPGTTGGGDKGPKARRTGGRGSTVGPTKITHENWDHERSVGGRPRKGKDARERFSVRAEPATRAVIAETGMNESDFLGEAAKLVAMARTGAQADELMRAVLALAGGEA